MPAQIRRIFNRAHPLFFTAILTILAVPLGIAHAAGASSNQQVICDFSGNRGWIIGALIILMGVLFYFLFQWQHRIEQSGYFANIYSEAIEQIEFDRHALRLQQAWGQGAYADELLSGGSDRANNWGSSNPMPKADDYGLPRLADELNKISPRDEDNFPAIKRSLLSSLSNCRPNLGVLDDIWCDHHAASASNCHGIIQSRTSVL